MMNYQNLWGSIRPNDTNITQIKRDIQEGKVPELPFFIIGLNSIKEKLSDNLKHIDEYFQSSLIQADYGNGKTNLLKYLKLYYQLNDKFNINVIYTRADVDQYDIILFLLRTIQESILDELILSIDVLKGQLQIESLCNNFNDTFGAIREYAFQLFADQEPDQLKKLIYLGTGRLYTKGSFYEFKLPQLSNYNRREILVLFLNILASNNKYYIFQIDEVEKIQEKSKTRFSSFLTSFRELIDLSPFIKGHYLMTTLTGASGRSSSQSLDEVNPAFYRRIESNLVQLDFISNTDELSELSKKLNELLETNKSDDEIRNIVASLRGKGFNKTSQIIKFICRELNASARETQSLDSILAKYSLKDLFDETHERIQDEGVFQNISRRFFDPLCDYLDASNIIYERRAQGYQLIFDRDFNRVHLFCFNNEIDSNINRINSAIKEYPTSKLIIFKPEQLELTYSLLAEHNIVSPDNFEIIEYVPEKMMTLLVMCRDESYEFDNIKNVIKEYTRQYL